MSTKKRIVIMGAGGRDFHNFNRVFRDDADSCVVAFTAAQIPGIAGRVYPPSLAGPAYPDGIPIVDEKRLPDLIAEHSVDEVVLAYSDLSHADVMHKTSIVLACGADFRLLGPGATMIRSSRPVIAVCAVRTGCGKSQTSRRIGQILLDHGLRVALVRHPMPYGDLERMRVQRFATLADIDNSNPTVEEREEYEEPVRSGMVMYAGVDYAEILRHAEREADVIIWDGGNNDFPFFAPDLFITVADPLRPGHELAYHPGETNVRMADAVVINKIDSAADADVARVVANVRSVNPEATIVMAESPVSLSAGPALAGQRVLVIEDGPTITHGGMPFGAGTVAARRAGVTDFVDPRPYAVGSIVDTYATYPDVGAVLPAMGYGDAQLRDLAQTINAADCDTVVIGTPIDLGRLIEIGRPARRVTYELREVGTPTLADLVAPHLPEWRARLSRREVFGGQAPEALVSAGTPPVRGTPDHGTERVPDWH
jgi:predicted GTPase